MDFSNKIEKVKTKEDFITFIEFLKSDKLDNASEWQNNNIESYLDSIASWVEDMDGYYENMQLSMPQNVNWSFIATLFYIGKIYE